MAYYMAKIEIKLLTIKNLMNEYLREAKNDKMQSTLEGFDKLFKKH